MNLESLKQLHHKKAREAEQRYLLEGEHLVLELQRAAERDPRLRTAEVYITHERGLWPSALKTHVINARHMAQLSETRSAQGIVAVVPMLPPAAPRAEERVICLHEIQDPGNLGTILRGADAAGEQGTQGDAAQAHGVLAEELPAVDAEVMFQGVEGVHGLIC